MGNQIAGRLGILQYCNDCNTTIRVFADCIHHCVQMRMRERIEEIDAELIIHRLRMRERIEEIDAELIIHRETLAAMLVHDSAKLNECRVALIELNKRHADRKKEDKK